MSKLRKSIELELKETVSEGEKLFDKFKKEPPLEVYNKLSIGYQCWYTRALSLVKELVPDRLEEFIWLYQADKRDYSDLNSYGIRDYLFGLAFKDSKLEALKHIVLHKFGAQLSIVTSAVTQIDNLFLNIGILAQSEVLDGEIKAAYELFKSNHLRAAGTIAGVVLERHLSGICKSKGFEVKNKNPSISELNDRLKEEGIIDIPVWRRFQHLSDIRNYCCHPKERDPTKDEVEELIISVEKIINSNQPNKSKNK